MLVYAFRLTECLIRCIWWSSHSVWMLHQLHQYCFCVWVNFDLSYFNDENLKKGLGVPCHLDITIPHIRRKLHRCTSSSADDQLLKGLSPTMSRISNQNLYYYFFFAKDYFISPSYYNANGTWMTGSKLVLFAADFTVWRSCPLQIQIHFQVDFYTCSYLINCLLLV